MASSSHAKQLEFCPPEVIYHIVEHLPRYDLQAFSYVSKGIRAFCLPLLFRNVQFEFSKDGFDELEAFLESGLRTYVVSFTYKVPELLKPEILDYSEFKTQILTPDSYVEEFESRENLDDIDSGDEERRFQTYLCPSYGLVYKTLRNICAGQRLIIRSGRDLALLTLAFQRLPHLTEFGLDFSRSFVDIDWVQSLLCLSMTSEENSAAHHTVDSENGFYPDDCLSLLGPHCQDASAADCSPYLI